jgi:hypothetical protein
MTDPDEMRAIGLRAIARHWRVLNRLEPHLGCVLCRGELDADDGTCDHCEAEHPEEPPHA